MVTCLTMKWFQKCQRCESKQQIIYVLKESLRCEQSSTYVLFDHSLVLSNGYKLFPNNQFNAGQCTGQKSPWRHWCLKNSWALVPETFQRQMLKIEEKHSFLGP